jgi:nucleoside-diphosphate-sugar epimerase
VYVRDVVKANMLAMTCKGAAGEFFNIASGTRVTINKLAEALKETVNKKDIKNIHKVPRPGDARHSYADTGKAKKMLGFTPSFSLEEGIGELVNWYVKDQKL